VAEHESSDAGFAGLLTDREHWRMAASAYGEPGLISAAWFGPGFRRLQARTALPAGQRRRGLRSAGVRLDAGDPGGGPGALGTGSGVAARTSRSPTHQGPDSAARRANSARPRSTRPLTLAAGYDPSLRGVPARRPVSASSASSTVRTASTLKRPPRTASTTSLRTIR
jgi:hypothetical protein